MRSRISARLPYVLAASRFAHYLKVICRDKVGSFQTKDTLSTHLNRWISSYILGTDDAGQESTRSGTVTGIRSGSSGPTLVVGNTEVPTSAVTDVTSPTP